MIDEDIARRQDLYAVKEAAARLCNVHPGNVEGLAPDSDEARDVRHMILVVESRIEKVDDSFFQPFPFLKIHKPPMAPRWLVCAIARDYGIQNDLLPFDDDDDKSESPALEPPVRQSPLPPRFAQRGTPEFCRRAYAGYVAHEAVSTDPAWITCKGRFKQKVVLYLTEHAAELGLVNDDGKLAELVIRTIAQVFNPDESAGPDLTEDVT